MSAVPWLVELSPGTCYGTITIDAVAMHSAAWTITDMSDLMSTPDQRGDDVIVPLVAGRLGYPRVLDRTVYRLPFVVCGGTNVTGDRIGEVGNTALDGAEGLKVNRDYLNTNVVSPPGVGDGTRELVWNQPGGLPTLTVDVHVAPLKGRLHAGHVFIATLEISVPDPTTL